MTLRRQIVDRRLAAICRCRRPWLDALNQFQNEQRSIDYVTLGPAQAGDIPPPTAEELGKYFDERKILFRAPEYRKIATVLGDAGGARQDRGGAPTTTSSAFRQHRNRYGTPERRHVEQIVFPNMAEAQAAGERIKAA